jgi:alpha-beta hydrolase superfamily lysophospholipase
MPDAITITFEADGLTLVGSLHLPEAGNAPFIIGCHGLLANRNSPKQIDLARTCNENGLAYFRFDHRGCGESQGNFMEVTTLEARCRDLDSAVKTLTAHQAVGPMAGLFGSSFGGTVVLAYACHHDVPRLMTYAAPLNSHDIQHDSIRDSNGRFHPAAGLPRNLAFDLEPNLQSIHNVYVVHSRNDETVPVSHARRIYDCVNEPKSLQIFKGGDHRMSDPDHQQLFRDIFLQWFGSNCNGMRQNSVSVHKPIPGS